VVITERFIYNLSYNICKMKENLEERANDMSLFDKAIKSIRKDISPCIIPTGVGGIYGFCNSIHTQLSDLGYITNISIDKYIMEFSEYVQSKEFFNLTTINDGVIPASVEAIVYAFGVGLATFGLVKLGKYINNKKTLYEINNISKPKK